MGTGSNSEFSIRRRGHLHQLFTISSYFLNAEAIEWNVNKKQFSRLTDRAQARILNIKQARNFLAEGWAAADLHVHTLHSYDVIPTRQVDPLTLYHKAQRLGMTFIAFTDHDSMDAYDQIGWTREGFVPLWNPRLSIFSIPAKPGRPDFRTPGEWGVRRLTTSFSCPV